MAELDTNKRSVPKKKNATRKRKKAKAAMRNIWFAIKWTLVIVLAAQFILAMTNTTAGYIVRAVPFLLYDGVSSGRVADSLFKEPEAAVIEQFETLPLEMRAGFYEDNIDIIFNIQPVNSNFSKKVDAFYTTTASGERFIGITQPKDAVASGAIFHEFAHYLDNSAGTKYSETEEFLNAYTSDKGANALYYMFFGEGNYVEKDKYSEAFAQMFECYVTRPATLKHIAPTVYEYFDNLFQQYE